ncbi:MAG TPA: hypothetical protein VNC50_02750, partial [Planctomycetia bacterium]|nr:hypothetical protein [Planctomycetia bacterium]
MPIATSAWIAWRNRSRALCLAGAVAGVVVLSSTGCTRTFYRNRADKAASTVIESQNCDPRWQVRGFNVYP